MSLKDLHSIYLFLAPPCAQGACTTLPHPLPPPHPLHYKNINKADNAVMVKDSFFHLKDKKLAVEVN